MYIDSILEPIVKSWIETGQNFVLKENGDSGHGSGKSNIMKTWKKTHGLEYYFNCLAFPDFFFIENCWQPPKQHIKRYPHWDDSITKKLIYERWSHVSQHFINEKIASMPDR